MRLSVSAALTTASQEPVEATAHPGTGPAEGRTVHFGHGGALPYEVALALGIGTLLLRPRDAPGVTPWVVEVARYLDDADRVDRLLLRRTSGSVLDVGSGPGRMVAEARRRGRVALGIDVSPAAVAVARAAGRPVEHCSVFDDVPGEGGWGTTLLLDGNIGIGGDPEVLLARCAELTAPGGIVVVESDLDPERDHRFAAVLVAADGSGSAAFPWAVVGSRVVESVARTVGLAPHGRLRRGGRHFVLLRRGDARQ
jgi:SAM-dependent methyltransferase